MIKKKRRRLLCERIRRVSGTHPFRVAPARHARVLPNLICSDRNLWPTQALQRLFVTSVTAWTVAFHLTRRAKCAKAAPGS